jgi:hypothetical protein
MVIKEEWPFLKEYLPQWPRVQHLLIDGAFEVVSNKKTLFYYHLVLKKGV